MRSGFFGSIPVNRESDARTRAAAASGVVTAAADAGADAVVEGGGADADGGGVVAWPQAAARIASAAARTRIVRRGVAGEGRGWEVMAQRRSWHACGSRELAVQPAEVIHESGTF